MSYEFEYEVQGAATFLVYQKKKEDIIDSMSMGMISNNKIEGILPFIYTQVEENIYFKYNISAKNTLQQYFSGVVTKKSFLGVLDSLADAFLQAEEYMLDMSSIILDTNYIFVNPNTSEASVIVLPLRREGSETLESFVRLLLFSVQFDRTEDCSYIAELINFLNSNQFFSLTDFKKLLNHMMNGSRNGNGGVQWNGGEKMPSQIPQQMQPPVGGRAPQQVPPMGETAPQPQPGRVPQPPVGGRAPQPQPPVGGRAPQPQMGRAPQSQPGRVPQPQMGRVPQPPVGGRAPQPQMGRPSPQPAGKPEKAAKKEKGRRERMPAPPPFHGMIPGAAMGSPIPPQPQMGRPPQPSQPPVGRVSQVQPPKKDRLPQIPPQPQGRISQPAEVKAASPMQKQQLTGTNYQIPPEDFGKTVDLTTYQNGTTVLTGNGSDTTLLTGTTVLTKPKQRFFLCRKKTGEEFEITESKTKVGRDASRNHIYIMGNSAISSEHAVFMNQDESVCIMDSKSTNGTFLNGSRLNPGSVSAILQEGDKIRLADEEFEFRIRS